MRNVALRKYTFYADTRIQPSRGDNLPRFSLKYCDPRYYFVRTLTGSCVPKEE